MVDQLARDLKHAARALWRDRSFTATTVATLPRATRWRQGSR